MIKYIQHTEIDKKRWDSCINNSVTPFVYATSWYLDVVSPHWDALILDDYSAVMPLPWKKKYFITYLVQPPFCQQLGVFGDETAITKTDDFIRVLINKYPSIRINLNEKNSVSIKGVKTVEKVNYILKLNRPYLDIFKNYSSIHKKNIKTGRNRRILIQETVDITLFYNFYMEEHKKKYVLQNSAYRILYQILKSIPSISDYKILYARSESADIIAAIFMLKSFNRWILLHTTTADSGRSNRAVHLLIDKFIQDHAEKDEIFDFEGSEIKGVADFFIGFGAESVNYRFIQHRKFPFIP